jgi:hypothetical protein
LHFPKLETNILIIITVYIMLPMEYKWAFLNTSKLNDGVIHISPYLSLMMLIPTLFIVAKIILMAKFATKSEKLKGNVVQQNKRAFDYF